MPEMVEYLQDTWLEPFKYNLIRYYTNDTLHFGTTVTSRAEGAHSVLKSYLQVSTGDLKQVVAKIVVLLNNQYAEYITKREEAKQGRPYHLRTQFLHRTVGYIAPIALNKVLAEWQKVVSNTNPLGPCSGVLTATWGIPCAHFLQNRLFNGEVLGPDDFHLHWHLDRDPQRVVRPPIDPLLQIGDPLVIRRRGRPARTRAAAQNSTQRAASGWEFVERGGRGRTGVRARGNERGGEGGVDEATEDPGGTGIRATADRGRHGRAGGRGSRGGRARGSGRGGRDGTAAVVSAEPVQPVQPTAGGAFINFQL